MLVKNGKVVLAGHSLVVANLHWSRWRTRGHQSTLENQNPNQHRQNHQQRQTPLREGGFGSQHQRTAKTGTPGLTTMSGNAWANNSDRANQGVPSRGPVPDQHVPVNNFNAQEARDMLRIGISTHRSCRTAIFLTSEQHAVHQTRKKPIFVPQIRHKALNLGDHGPRSVRQAEWLLNCQED